MPLIRSHPYTFICLPIMGLSTIFALTSILGYIIVPLWLLANLHVLCRQVNYRALACFSLALTPLIAGVFVSSYYFGQPGDMLNPTSAAKLTLGYQLSLRLVALAITSFMFVSQTNWEQVFLTAMQRRHLSCKTGFALLAVFNASHYLQQEFKRIQLAYQMLYQRRWWSPIIVLPLMVAAARYAHQLSISMHSRGLNEQRSYYHQAPTWRWQDSLLLLINGAFLLICLLINYA